MKRDSFRVVFGDGAGAAAEGSRTRLPRQAALFSSHTMIAEPAARAELAPTVDLSKDYL